MIGLQSDFPMADYRLARLREQLAKRDLVGALLSDPINIRYATDTSNMSIWTLHAPGRYVYIATEGPVTLFEFASSKHLNANAPLVDEVRVSTPWSYFMVGEHSEGLARHWAKEIAALVRANGGTNRRIAVDRCDPLGAQMLMQCGLTLCDVGPAIEHARMIKSAAEIEALRRSMVVCDEAVQMMRENLAPGMTENALWSLLHQVNIARGGEWIECRLLASGHRTNPWFQESSNRVIEAGDIVAFDTDMIGPGGYLADISRSYICPGKRASDEQRKLYGLAEEQVMHNLEMLKPGMSFREIAERSWVIPPAYARNRYMTMIHGVGMVDEYPFIPDATDFEQYGYDGVLELDMVVSVESYIGAEDGREGVKLEQQVRIGPSGAEIMSNTPMLGGLELR
jgi:Xaa-Pro aminopeptidase